MGKLKQSETYDDARTFIDIPRDEIDLVTYLVDKHSHQLSGRWSPQQVYMSLAGRYAAARYFNSFSPLIVDPLRNTIMVKGYRLHVLCNDNQWQNAFIDEDNPALDKKNNITGFIYMHTDDGQQFEYLGKLSVVRLRKNYILKNHAECRAYSVPGKEFIK